MLRTTSSRVFCRLRIGLVGWLVCSTRYPSRVPACSFRVPCAHLGWALLLILLYLVVCYRCLHVILLEYLSCYSRSRSLALPHVDVALTDSCSFVPGFIILQVKNIKTTMNGNEPFLLFSSLIFDHEVGS